MPDKQCSLQKMNVLILTCFVISFKIVISEQDSITSCPSLTTSSSTIVTCKSHNDSENTEDCNTPTDGTIATFKCATFYENSELDASPTRTCQNGSWGEEIPSCSPICGVKRNPSFDETKGTYPWNVAIFRNEGNRSVFQCAGSLISEKIILTTAICVTDADGNKLPPSKYTVGAGTSSAIYEDPEDPDAQYSEVKEIFVSKKYKGSVGKYANDIAVVITKFAFNMSEKIQPICCDWNNSFPQGQDYLKITGYIPGPLKSHFFPKLKSVFEIEVPFVNDTRCREMLSPPASVVDFTKYLTEGKICAGYINSDMVPMCRVDIGAGLISKNEIDDRYYIRGVASLKVSVSYHSATCDNQLWLLFTPVDFILKEAVPLHPVHYPLHLLFF